MAKQGIGLVPEGRQAFPNLSVRENLIATATNYSTGKDRWTLDKVLSAELSGDSDLKARYLGI